MHHALWKWKTESRCVVTRTHAAKASKRRALKPATKTTTTNTGGRFTSGNKWGARIELLPGVDPASLADWMRPHFALQARYYSGALKSGMFKRTHGVQSLLRQAFVESAHHSALSAYAATRPIAEARGVLTDARAHATLARAAFSKVWVLVGHKRGDNASTDPLSALAREMGDDHENGGDGHAD